MDNGTQAPRDDDLAGKAEMHESDDHALEMLGRVYSEAVSRRAAISDSDGSARTETEETADESVEAATEVAVRVDEDACPINPRTILEAMLFVGTPGAGLTARKAAGLIRGVSPTEVDRLVEELNRTYESDVSAFRIRDQGDGYRLTILAELEPIRQQFYGRIREARLGSAAIEVLAVVAYHQPVTADDVDKLRNRQSVPVLNLLVRRELLAVERDPENRRIRRYRTTPRFLELFGMATIEDLPQAHLPHSADFLDE